jgi:hypothetical protein
MEHHGYDTAKLSNSAGVFRGPEAEFRPHLRYTSAAVEREMRVIAEPGLNAGRLGNERLAEVVARLSEPSRGFLIEPHARLNHDFKASKKRDLIAFEVLTWDADPLPEPVDSFPGAADQLAVVV